MFYVYVLRSESTGRRYIGSTANIAERLSQHNAGYCKATKHGVPWKLVYQETSPNRADAVTREKFLKTGRGREELAKIQDRLQIG